MTRTIGFDYDQALDGAMRLFWRSGYAGTSLRELLKVIGIGEGSFYNTLKSKKRLYLACLDRYEETEGRGRMLALMSAPTAALGVRALFRAVLDCLDHPQTPSRLCMLAAMMSEEVLSDAELRSRVGHNLRNFQACLAKRFRNDREAGLLPAGLEPDVVAAVIATYAQGLWRVAMADYNRTRFERQIDVFLIGLGL